MASEQPGRLTARRVAHLQFYTDDKNELRSVYVCMCVPLYEQPAAVAKHQTLLLCQRALGVQDTNFTYLPYVLHATYCKLALHAAYR